MKISLKQIKIRIMVKKNSNLSRARAAKNDEFYTRIADIEKELKYYQEHFKDKIVYCNCDNPYKSDFVTFFRLKFTDYGIKKLICTCITEDNSNGLSYEWDRDIDGNEILDMWESKVKPLQCNGDFRSSECIEYLKEADIVVTNPPFSLFREYVAQLMEHNKKFLIIGTYNAITYKKIFPLIKDNKIWLGINSVKEFKQPDGSIKKFGNICWFTNLTHSKRNEKLVLFETYSPKKFPKYDNYDAIEVSKVVNIPKDYDGVMGVPITFMDKYNPEQFEIVDLAKKGVDLTNSRTKIYTKSNYKNYSDLNSGPVLNKNGVLHNIYSRILIKRKDEN